MWWCYKSLCIFTRHHTPPSHAITRLSHTAASHSPSHSLAQQKADALDDAKYSNLNALLDQTTIYSKFLSEQMVGRCRFTPGIRS